MVAVAYETEDEIDSEAELSADDGPVVIYAAAPESETVVLFESAPEEQEAPEDEQVVDTSTASDVDVEIEAEPDPDPEPELVSETATKPAGFGATMRRLLWGVSSTSKD